MKKNIEHSIKQSLENYELPYNSSAWSVMSAKLDAVSPSGTSSSVENAVKSSLENNTYPYNPAAWTALEASLGAGAGAAVGAGIGEALKSSLENHEIPYNPDAWTRLESKLDKTPAGGSTKWYVAASILLTAMAVSYFVMSDSNTDENTDSPSTQVAQASSEESTSTAITKTTKQTSTNKNNPSNQEANGDVITIETGGGGSEFPSTPETGASLGGTDVTGGSADSGSGSSDGGTGEPSLAGGPAPIITPPTGISEPEHAKFVLPMISSVCEGSSIRITNENTFNLSIVYPNGSLWTGKPNSVTKLAASVPGTYKIGHLEEGSFSEEGTFVILDAPSANFEFVNLGETYLDGLPTTEVKSNSPGTQHEWSYGALTSTGREAAPHFFSKGNYDIELTVTGSNGCSSSITKTVTIHKDYNLLAMNAFDPNSLDARNNTYIPNALVKREDVKFTMIIVDPEDGHIMYETSDASQGWDGVDRTTGEQLGYQKTFIWKVTIENPEAGERPVYGGSAVIIPRQN